MIFRKCVLFLILCSTLVLAKSPADLVQSLVAEHDRNLSIWSAKMERAKSGEEVNRLQQTRPDTKKYADAILKAINPYLDVEWSVKYMAWLIRNHPQLVIEKNQNDGGKAIIDREQIFMDYVDRYHVQSKDAGVFVVSLMFSERLDALMISRKRALADKVYVAHANKNNEVMGTAALACGHFIPPGIGNSEAKLQMLGYFKTAAMHAYDVRIGGQTVGEIVGDKVYVLNRLSKGSPVPLFEGFDATQNPLSMMEYKGKYVMLCFWSEQMTNFPEFVMQMNTFIEAGEKYGIHVLGITRDEVSSVRNLIGKGIINWKSLIDVNGEISQSFRVNQVPHCYIVDEDGKILYSGSFGGPLFGSVVAEKRNEIN